MKLYIGNLPEGGQIKAEDVRGLFSRYGEAWDCVIIKNYGFIHMEEEGGNKAIKQLDGFKLEGKRMRVEKSMRSVGRRYSRESKLGESRIKEEKLMRSSSRESMRSFSNESLLGESRIKDEKLMRSSSKESMRSFSEWKLGERRIKEKSMRSFSEWKLGERRIKEKSMRSFSKESKLGESRIKEEKAMESESKKLFVSNIADETTSEQLKEAFETCCYVIEVDKRRENSFGFVYVRANSAEILKIILKMNLLKLNGKRMSVHNSNRLETFNPVSVGNYSRLGGLGHTDFENNRNNTSAPFNSAMHNGLNEFGDFNCNRKAGAGLCKPVSDFGFKRRLAGSNVFRDSGLFGLGNSVGNCSCNNLGGLSKTVGDHNCNMLGGCSIVNDGRFNMMAGVCSTIGEHRCNKAGRFNADGGNNLDGFGGTVGDDVYRHGGCACGCKSAVNDCNSYRLSAFRNTVSDNRYERMGRIVIKEEKDHGSSDSANRGNGDADIKIKIAQLNKIIKTEERKPLINERLVNDWRNQVNCLERKMNHQETKTEFELRSQLQYLQKRVRDLQEEKKVYMDQDLDDHGARSLPANQRSSKTNKRVKPSTPESSSKQKQSTNIRHSKTKPKHETGDMSDDDIQVIDASDDEEEIKIIDEREGEDVEILSESEFKEDKIFRNRGRDDNVNYISENEVEIMSVNGSKRRKSLTKDDSKNGMQFEKFREKCDWGVVKSERFSNEDIPLICLEDEKEDVKDISKDKDEKQANFANDSNDNNDEMQNMSDMLGEVFNEGHDENPFQGVPPLDQVLGVPPPRRDVMSSKRKRLNVFKREYDH